MMPAEKRMAPSAVRRLASCWRGSRRLCKPSSTVSRRRSAQPHSSTSTTCCTTRATCWRDPKRCARRSPPDTATCWSTNSRTPICCRPKFSGGCAAIRLPGDDCHAMDGLAVTRRRALHGRRSQAGDLPIPRRRRANISACSRSAGNHASGQCSQHRPQLPLGRADSGLGEPAL